jgi:serine/threonine protein kinase/dipeptidyl aminopeptidase/acylaminoacyl peptidase
VPSEQEHDELLMSLVESVRELTPEEREAHLRALCPDSALFQEVRMCIEWEERMGRFLLDPLLQRPRDEDAFAPGNYLGPRFRIVREVGHGGMGIVYEATDLELDLRVALKCAKPGHSNRLPPEARAAREVSHFNVCKVHDLHKVATEFGDMDFLSMEFIDGETLTARLAREGRLGEDEAREIACQVCAGLAQAHRQGVIHGDLKCSNIMLARAPEGGVRAIITDFGLAKLQFADGKQLLGVQGGTFDYMAPELFGGEPATVASDLYALGVLFHVILTGHAPERVHPSLARGLVQTWNAGSNASTVIVDRKIADKDWERKVAELPSRWKKVVACCLLPQPGSRFASAEDVRQALTRPPPWIRWAAGGAVAAALGGGWLLWAENQGDRLENLVQLTSATDLSTAPSLSRDGKTIVYESDRAEPGNLDIWIQQLPGGGARRLTTDSAQDEDPSVSPDGSTVAFRSERNGGDIYLVDATGGNERLLGIRGRNPRFSPDGRRIVYWTGDRNESAPSGRLYLIPATGGIPTRLAADFGDARLPIWSSDGRFILFSGCRGLGQPLRTCLDWWVTRADGASFTKTGALPLLRRQEIVPADNVGVWWGERVVFGGMRGGKESLWELSLSPELRAVGRPRQLTSGDAGEIGVTVANDGSIAVGRMSGALHVWRIDHAATPLAASPAKVTGEGATDISPSVSRNGRWLVFGRRAGRYREIWLKDLRSGREAASVISRFDKASPLIDNSGATIVYEQRETEVSTIWLARGQSQRKLCTACSNPTAWFGEEAFFYSGSIPSKIMVMDIQTGGSRVALDAPSVVGNADWSPANQYLLFTASHDGSRKQVFATRFPLGAAQPWIPVTGASEGSDRPRWSGDGRIVFYLSDRDGFSCVWGQRFDPILGKSIGPPFWVAHYHNPRISPARVRPTSLSMAVSGDSIFLNLGEEAESIWTGNLKPGHLFPIPFF